MNQLLTGTELPGKTRLGSIISGSAGKLATGKALGFPQTRRQVTEEIGAMYGLNDAACRRCNPVQQALVQAGSSVHGLADGFTEDRTG